jgi:hypothetical protein
MNGRTWRRRNGGGTGGGSARWPGSKKESMQWLMIFSQDALQLGGVGGDGLKQLCPTDTTVQPARRGDGRLCLVELSMFTGQRCMLRA